MKMIKITQTFYYWLFELVDDPDHQYLDNTYYIRMEKTGMSGYIWFIGREYKENELTHIDQNLSDDLVLDLEKRFQAKIRESK